MGLWRKKLQFKHSYAIWRHNWSRRYIFQTIILGIFIYIYIKFLGVLQPNFCSSPGSGKKTCRQIGTIWKPRRKSSVCTPKIFSLLESEGKDGGLVGFDCGLFRKKQATGTHFGGIKLDIHVYDILWLFMVILRVQSCKIAAFGSRMTPEKGSYLDLKSTKLKSRYFFSRVNV